MRREGKWKRESAALFIPPNCAAAYCSVGIELHGKSGNLISLELFSAELLNKSVLHNVNSATQYVILDEVVWMLG